MKQPPLTSVHPPPLIFLSPPSPNSDPKISPSVLLIIVILAVIFFLAGIVHLLVRCLLNPTQRYPDERESVSALQGQLQQLFQLHDAGVDQSYIDTLPVFQYKSIIGVKDPFDCAVCLSEFETEDKLRLLPKCSHAFHMDCIDTWLLSHSTCPLCRSSLIDELSDGFSPVVCVLESGRNSGSDSDPRAEPETGSKEEEEKIVNVKLGKFRNLEVNGGEGSSEINNEMGERNELGSRRCFSMGSFAYILDERTSLQVPIRTPMKKQSSRKKPSLPLKPGHKAAMSEYGSDSRREFNGIEAFRTIHEIQNLNEKNGNEREKEESFSISKIWARTGERNRKGNVNGGISSRRTISESEIVGDNDEIQSCYSVDSLANNNPSSSTSTSTRRTLLWLMGKQQKFLHNHSSSLSSNV